MGSEAHEVSSEIELKCNFLDEMDIGDSIFFTKFFEYETSVFPKVGQWDFTDKAEISEVAEQKSQVSHSKFRFRKSFPICYEKCEKLIF